MNFGKISKKKNFLLSLEHANKTKIEFDTSEQSNSQAWFKECRILLTASRFGQICKMRPNKSCKNNVYSILYASQVQLKSLQHGRNMEAVARTRTEEIIGENMQACSLLIDPVIPYLAANSGTLIYNIF